MTRRGTLDFQRAAASAVDSLYGAVRRRIGPPTEEAPRHSGKLLPNTWDSIESFYSDGELGARRRRSGERDYGTHWRQGRDWGPFWRVSLVIDTGEVYAVCVADPGWAPEGGQVRLLGVGLSAEEADERLDGWAKVCGNPHSTRWLDERLALPTTAVRA